MDFTVNPYYNGAVEDYESYRDYIAKCKEKREAIQSKLYTLKEDTADISYLRVEFLKDFAYGGSSWCYGFLNIFGVYELAKSDRDGLRKINGEVLAGKIIFDDSDRHHRRPKVLAGTIVEIKNISKSDLDFYLEYHKEHDADAYSVVVQTPTQEEVDECYKERKSSLEKELSALNRTIDNSDDKLEERRLVVERIKQDMMSSEKSLTRDGVVADDKDPCAALMVKTVQYDVFKQMKVIADRYDGEYFTEGKPRRGFVFPSQENRDKFLEEYLIQCNN